MTLTDPMKNPLNRAFNFAILPLKLDITEVLVDLYRYSRAIIWHEYWHGKEEEGDNEHFNPIFKKTKTIYIKIIVHPQL